MSKFENSKIKIVRILALLIFLILALFAFFRFFNQSLSDKLNSLGSIDNLGGTELSEVPYFFHKNVFVGGQRLDVALDPKKYPLKNGNKANVLIVDHKNIDDWLTNSSTQDVTSNIETFTVNSGAFNQNIVTAWNTIPTTIVENHPWYKHYDIIIDFDQDITSFSSNEDIIDLMGETELGYQQEEGGITVVKDPSEEGELEVRKEDYQFKITSKSLENSCICEPPIILSTLSGAIYYPRAGTDGIIADTLGTLPMVLISHGVGGSKEGFEYLAMHLASRGMVAITVDMIETSLQGEKDIVFRGEVILEHLNYLLESNLASSFIKSQLRRKVDIRNIGLVGHSKGGEGVIAAKNLSEKLNPQRFRITAVCSLAPSEHSIEAAGITSEQPCNFILDSSLVNCGYLESTPPYLMIYGARDNDTNFGQGYRILDRTIRDKYGITLLNGSHKGFDAISSNGANPEQRSFTKALVLSFMNVYLKREQFYLPILAGHVDYDLKNTQADILLYSFHPSGGDGVGKRSSIDDFEDTNELVNNYDSAIIASNLICMDEEWLGYEMGCDSCVAENFYVHYTNGLKVAWNNSQSVASIELPIGDQDLTSFSYLNFRVAQRYREDIFCNLGFSNEVCCNGQIDHFGCVGQMNCDTLPCPEVLNAALMTQDLSVSINDSIRPSNIVKVSTYYPHGIPYVIIGQSGVGTNFIRTNTIMQTITIPLDGFKAYSNVNMQNIESIQLYFNQTIEGEMIIDDVELVGLNPLSLAQ